MGAFAASTDAGTVKTHVVDGLCRPYQPRAAALDTDLTPQPYTVANQSHNGARDDALHPVGSPAGSGLPGCLWRGQRHRAGWVSGHRFRAAKRRRLSAGGILKEFELTTAYEQRLSSTLFT
jgi:hypothetical protein